MMRMLACAAVTMSVLLATSEPAHGAPTAPLPLVAVADVALPGHASRFDYQWVDAKQRRLYMTHLGDGSLVVFDLEAQRVVREIPGLPSVHGVVDAPDRHLVFATVTGSKSLAVIDDRSFEVLARAPAGEYPNGLAYDPRSDRVFVSNNSGLGVGVVDVKGDAKAAHALPGLDIGGGAGNTQYDAETGHVLAAVHGKPFLVDIDPAAPKVDARIPLRQVGSCHGLHVASSARLAFAACGGASGPTLVVVDLELRKQVATAPLPAGVDVLAFDGVLQRLYAAAESGMVAVFSVAADHSVTELGRGVVGPNAHSVAVDETTHRVYFPLADVGGHPVLRVMQPR